MTLDLHEWIEVSEPGTALVVRIGGELDEASREVIEPAVVAGVITAHHVILDLSELTSCDSSGVAMFIAAQEKAAAEGTTLSVRHPTPPVRRVFELAGLDAVIDITE